MTDEGYRRGESFAWESAEDLTAASVEGLRGDLARLVQEERDLASRLELVRGRIALARAALAGRGLATVGTEELARVLLGEERKRGEY